MSVRILEGIYDGGSTAACLVCSTSGTVFGPLLRDTEEAERLLSRLERDARRYDDVDLIAELLRMREADEEEAAADTARSS